MSAWGLCFAIVLAGFPHFVSCTSSKCLKNSDCINGICNSGICVCNPNWWGDLCQFCRERRSSNDVRSEHVIIEGNDNLLPSKCAWLIEIDKPGVNRSIILNVNEFSGTCRNRRLNIYDGNSVCSPLLAVVSNFISTGSQAHTTPVLQLRAKSGSAFIVLAGKEDKSVDAKCSFNITYSFEEECSVKCSSHGFCSQKSSPFCDCDVGWISNNCSLPICPVLCINNSCDTHTRKCACRNGRTGESCEISDRQSFWSLSVANNQDILDGVASHAMVLLGNHIWLYGGFSFSKGPVDTLARYSIKYNTWEIIQASSGKKGGPGARYGHSLVAFNNSLIVFGGFCLGVVSDETWTFNTISAQWTLLDIKNHEVKPVGVTGHTATVVGQEMIVLFGYSPEDGFVDKIQVFDLVSRVWSSKGQLPGTVKPRYGHSSVRYPQTGHIIIHGGYRMLNNSCYGASSDTFYYHSVENEWYKLPSSGIPRFLHSAVLVGSAMIVVGGKGNHGLPSHRVMHFDIAGGNEWRIPSDSDVPETVSRYGHAAVEVNSVMYAFGGFRGTMMNSFLQYSLAGDCLLPGSLQKCFQPVPSPVLSIALLSSTDICVLHKPQEDGCHLRRSCQDCVSADSEDSCVWCESQRVCVSSAVYDVTFPYLECVQMLERGGTATCADLECSGMKSCRDCHMLAGCGWCDDGSGTGLGQCMPGGSHEPFPGNSSSSCSKRHWNFIDCPACQCNGHSRCVKGNSCGECEDNTRGTHCEECAVGFYGDPRNGGNCSACLCTSHAKTCCASTGVCHCLTLGVIGKRCDECDSGQDYHGNAEKDGVCFYSFKGSRKKFNLTGLERLSFEYHPKEMKQSIKLQIEWADGSLGSEAMFNLTTFFAKKPEDGERMVHSSERVGNEPFETIFPYHDYDFSHADKFGFRGYIYDVNTNGNSAMLMVNIMQVSENIDLLEFFLTFFGCFLSLLVVAGVLWKARSRYINFVLNRQRREERQKMASRPFGKVSILLNYHFKSTPGPVAVEACENGRAAVITVLMRLPGTKDGFAPVGQTGVCFASVLGSYGDPTKTTPTGKVTRIRTHKRCNGTCV